MAMLAEPRRKVRYTVNPSGEDWASGGASGAGGPGADGQFGQRMLKSMGWREGQGLGKDGQGAPEPIRVKQKNDQRGVGCSGAYAAESMPQSVDFASLLSQLNEAHARGSSGGCHGNSETTPAATTTAAAPVSLEAKSRSSRARLHYHKFTRGKDVSAYDSQSLACIFGDRASTESWKGGKKDAAVEDVDDEEGRAAGFGFCGAALKQSQSEACLTPASEQSQQQPQQSGLQLVQSQTSLQDYFRAKMQARMLAVAAASAAASCVPEIVDAESWTSESSCSAASTLSEGDVELAAAADAVASPPMSKKVCFSVSPRPEPQPSTQSVAVAASSASSDVDDSDLVVIDFALFPGSNWQRVLGYPHY